MMLKVNTRRAIKYKNLSYNTKLAIQQSNKPNSKSNSKSKDKQYENPEKKPKPKAELNVKVKSIKLCIYGLIIMSVLMILKPSYLLAKSMLAQVLLEYAWLQSQQAYFQLQQSDYKNTFVEKTQARNFLPWQWADTYPVAKLSYLKKGASWIVLAGMTGRTMAFAPSWLEDSAKPNQYGNTVISAHNDSHFKELEYSELGDLFTLEDRKGKLDLYKVFAIEIIHKSDVSPYLFQDETMITLITCYPFSITNTSKEDRLVIRAIKVLR